MLANKNNTYFLKTNPYRRINIGIKIYRQFIFQFVWTSFTTANKRNF